MTKNEKRGKWFRAGAEALARTISISEALYMCPLCLQTFSPSRIDELTFEHAPTRANGGKEMALTCWKCNDEASQALDVHAANAEETFDFRSGTEEESRKAVLRAGKLKLNVRAHSTRDLMKISVLPKNNSPDRQDEFAELVQSGHMTDFELVLNDDKFSPWRSSLSWLRSAYIVSFALLGYRYVLGKGLQTIRDQIAQPSSRLISRFHHVAAKDCTDLRNIIDATSMSAICIQMGRNNVLLPRDPTDSEFYKRLSEFTNSTVLIKGQCPRWPTSPQYLLDLSF